MQTIEMLQTIEWIHSQYSERTRQLLFTNELFMRPSERDLSGDFLNATHEISRVRATLLDHPFALQVLRAFNLSDLVEESWPVHLSSLTGGREREGDTIQQLHSALTGVAQNWFTMKACVEPVQKLTTPSEVLDEKNLAEILTITIHSEKEIPVDSLSKVFTHADELYEGIARLMGIEQVEKLQVIYVASGSAKRFDLRGLGDVIKQAKEFIIELWQHIRYRRIEDSHRSNNAILESLTVLGKIEENRKENVLSDNEAESLRTRIFQSTMAFMNQGALIREIGTTETVQNQQLLEDRQQRLLPAPPKTETEAEAPANSQRGKKGRPRAAATKRGQRRA